jgi:hypothetical protein
MLAACARLILSGREDREHSNTVAAGLGGAGCGGSIEHALDDGGGLVAIGAVTELSPMSTALTAATALMRWSVAVAGIT